MRLLAWLFTIAVTASGGGWAVDFTPHPDNKAIQIVTECRDKEGKLTFFAVNAREVNEDSYWAWFPTPRGARNCNHEVQLVRFGDDPTQNYVAERYTIQ